MADGIAIVQRINGSGAGTTTKSRVVVVVAQLQLLQQEEEEEEEERPHLHHTPRSTRFVRDSCRVASRRVVMLLSAIAP